MFQAKRLNSSALRGFMRKVRWNDGLGVCVTVWSMSLDSRELAVTTATPENVVGA